MIISRTPFRISFFGGGTDYPAWYREHGGAVLATTIDKYCYLTCRYLPPFFDHRFRIVYSKMENCQTVEEIAHPSVRAVLQYLKIERGLEIHHDADLPARSGLGSSSSFTVGLLHALYGLVNYMPTKEQLARESIFVEQNLLKETVGCQDQVLAAHGGLNHVTFLANDDIAIRPIILPAERMAELNDHLMLFYTGIQRTASDIAETYVQDVDSKQKQLQLFSRMVDEGIAILTSTQDIARFGEMLHEAWQAKRTLSTQVSTSWIDSMYEQARGAGAIGGKLLGAGGGGFMILFVRPEEQDKVRAALPGSIHVPFKFERSGSQIIFYDRQEDFLQ